MFSFCICVQHFESRYTMYNQYNVTISEKYREKSFAQNLHSNVSRLANVVNYRDYPIRRKTTIGIDRKALGRMSKIFKNTEE